ncbi:C-C motif chemokine 4-like [Poecilia reticulata]|uniref:C-C motif chemokine 4-like n=1 Tax=Poecilia reticulata TaxID=8081 RepID=UPI0007EBA5B8|nr:PREDICTED: C-C motif chemokine 4-like [Poecilia reticulata]
MMSLTILFLLVTLMLPTFSAQGGISKCCLKNIKTKVHRTLLRSYHEQNDPSLCSVPSVVFTTTKGKKLCANPSNIWTKTSMAYLDGKNWQQKQTTLKKKLEN